MLSKQDLHNLAMKTVGDSLKENGFEFLTVNSKLKKDPQFICLKEKKLHFFLVRASIYPENPKLYNNVLVDKLKKHAKKFDAKTYFSGVGFANSINYEDPIQQDKPYVVNFDGWIQLD